MAVNKIVVQEFDDIGRGTSVTIPVLIKRLDGTPYDLTDFQAYFTLKEVQYDWDYEDARSTVHKEILINDPEEGRFFIQLSSKETWHTPGTYHFDLELVKNGAVVRIGFFKTNIVGAPTNRTITDSQEPLWLTDSIQITITGHQPLVIIAPLISDPPDQLIETVVAEPAYLLEELDSPTRNIKIKSYAPQVSFAMRIMDLHDAEKHYYRFENYSFPDLPPDCPFAAGGIEIENRSITFFLNDPMKMDVWDSYVQFSPEETHGGGHTSLMSGEPYFVGDNVAHGSLNIFLAISDQKYAHVVGNYVMPRHLNEPSYWMFRIDYFNWN